MTLIDLLTSPWAITQDKLTEIQGIYATHLRGEKIDIPAVEARLGRPLASEMQAYQLREGAVGHLALEGVIAPKANLFTQISGGVSSQMALRQVQSMHADPRVRSALVEFDTPGGSVFGVPAVANAIRAMAADKPVVTISTGMMASAGYWWGSAGNAVYISGLTDFVGSIGVVATHNYRPRAAQADQTTEITAGRYKRIASDKEPLTVEGRAYLQEQVDELYRVFVDAVAAHRGVSTAQVLDRMADGRVFVGQQAIDAGLVDGVSSVDALIEQLATNPTRFARRRGAVVALGSLPSVGAVAASQAAASTITHAAAAPAGVAEHAAAIPTDEPVPHVIQQPNPQGDPMDRQTLERDHPAIVAELRSEFMAAGAAAELERIQAVRASAMPGHEALIEQLAMDGKTTGAQAAQLVIAAHRQTLASQAAAHFADAPNPAPASSAPLDQETTGEAGAAESGAPKLNPLQRAMAVLHGKRTA